MTNGADVQDVSPDHSPKPNDASAALPHAGRDVLLDPTATERTGTLLADRLRPLGPATVVIWDEPQAAVLAHVVARELTCSIVRATSHEGLTHLIDETDGGAAVCLAAEFSSDNAVNALVGVASSAGMSVVAVAAATGSDALRAVHRAGAPLVVVADGSGSP